MKNDGFEIPWSRALGVASAFLIVGVQWCDPPPRTSPPAIVSDGHALLAAWEEPTDDGLTIYLKRITDVKDGITSYGSGTPIYRIKYATIGYDTPEIASGPDGSIVIVTRAAADKIAIPIDRDGNVAGPPQPLTGCRSDSSDRGCFWTCKRPVAHAGGFIVGHVSAYPRTSVRSLDLSFLDAMGRTTNFLVLPSSEPYSCVMAASSEELVVVSGEMDWPRKSYIHVQFLALADGSPIDSFFIPGGAVRSVVALGGHEFAMVHNLEDGRTVISRFGPEGVTRDWLVPDVDVATVDLGVSKRGAFMTWIKDRRVHLRDLPNDREFASRRVSSSAVGVRATSIGGRCITAWNNAGGGKLSVLAVPDCP